MPFKKSKAIIVRRKSRQAETVRQENPCPLPTSTLLDYDETLLKATPTGVLPCTQCGHPLASHSSQRDTETAEIHGWKLSKRNGRSGSTSDIGEDRLDAQGTQLPVGRETRYLGPRRRQHNVYGIPHQKKTFLFPFIFFGAVEKWDSLRYF